MIYSTSFFSIIEVLVVTIPVLLTVAFVTVAERKTMASMQRRVGPNIVGYYGLLQAFADALKLIIKEYISPTQANLILFFLGPIITLIFSLFGYAVIPYGPGLAIFDFDLGILYFLAVSSLATYGILLAGWSANSKYAFLGSLRSTAQLISYELIITSVVLVVVLLTSSLNLTVNIESQKSTWFMFPLFPLSIIFFISAIAETNRAPFDLAEAESELVSGFMTEHSAVIFVFFFLAEYASLVLMCIIVSILYLGGYNIDYSFFDYLYYFFNYTTFDADILLTKFFDYIYYDKEYNESYSVLGTEGFKYFYFHLQENNLYFLFNSSEIDNLNSNSVLINGLFSLILGIKTLIMVFIFIWVRASFPRIRFDQLMSYCWTVLLPIVFSLVILIPCVLYIYGALPCNGLFF